MHTAHTEHALARRRSYRPTRRAVALTGAFLFGLTAAAIIASPARGSACTIAPPTDEILIYGIEPAPRNVQPHISGFVPDGDIALANEATGEIVEVEIVDRGGFRVLRPVRPLEGAARYVPVAEDPQISERMTGEINVGGNLDIERPEKLRVTQSGHYYQEKEEGCGGPSWRSVIWIRFPVGEPGAYVEVQDAPTPGQVADAPSRFILGRGEAQYRPDGFERGDTVYVRARYHDAAGNIGLWSDIEEIQTPACDCTTPGAPAGPMKASAVFVAILGGLLLARRRLRSPG